MWCCNNTVKMCVMISECQDTLTLPIIAPTTDTYKMAYQFANTVILKDINVEQGKDIIVPNIFNESYAGLIRFIMPDDNILNDSCYIIDTIVQTDFNPVLPPDGGGGTGGKAYVFSVNGILPDSNGDVHLDASDVGAQPISEKLYDLNNITSPEQYPTAQAVKDWVNGNFVTGGANNFIQNQNVAAQTANFSINGNGKANNLTAINDITGAYLSINNSSGNEAAKLTTSGYSSVLILENTTSDYMTSLELWDSDDIPTMLIGTDNKDRQATRYAYIYSLNYPIIFSADGGTQQLTLLTSGKFLVGGTTDRGATFQVSGDIMTNQPSANGAGKWLLGKAKSGGVEISVDGTLYTIGGAASGTPLKVAYYNGSGTLSSASGMNWDEANTYLGLNDTTPSALLSVKNKAANDLATLGAQLLDATGWTTTGWSGDFTTGFTHTGGGTEVLSRAMVSPANTVFLLTFNQTGWVSGQTMTVSMGGTSEQTNGNSSFTVYLKSSGANQPLNFTPSPAYAGTITNIVLKQVIPISASINLKNSTGTVINDVRYPYTGCIGIGLNALSNLYAGSDGNIAIGQDSLRYHSTGAGCIAIGSFSQTNNLSGTGNISIGYYTMNAANGATNCVAIGQSALISLTTGASNVAIGSNVMYSANTASNNVAIGGASVLFSNTTGSFNIAIGSLAMQSTSTGADNVAVGYYALNTNTTGTFNTALGDSAGRYVNPTANNQTANYAVYLGANTKAKAAAQTNEIVIGANAIGNGSNTATIGDANVTDVYLSGNVRTTQPSANGAGAWRLGKLISGGLEVSVDGTVYNLATTTSSGNTNYIQNQNAAAQTATAWITGGLQANGGVAFDADNRFFARKSSGDVGGNPNNLRIAANEGIEILSYASVSLVFTADRFNTKILSQALILPIINFDSNLSDGSIWYRYDSERFRGKKANGTYSFTMDGLAMTAPLALYNTATAPSSPTNGFKYYDTALNKERSYINGVWQNVATENAVIQNQQSSAQTASFWITNSGKFGTTSLIPTQSGSVVNDALAIQNSGDGATLRIHNTNGVGFSGIEYLDNGGNTQVFTGYNNGVSGEFRFHNISSIGIIKFMINGANALIINNNLSISTGQPSANGAGNWKLGKLVTTAVTANTTRYIEISVDGVVYKLMTAT